MGTEELSADEHKVYRDDESDMIQVVPQFLSSLRRDLVFWENKQETTNYDDLLKEFEKQKLELDELKKKTDMIQVVPQFLSSLRRDLVLWENKQETTNYDDLLKEFEKQKLELD